MSGKWTKKHTGIVVGTAALLAILIISAIAIASNKPLNFKAFEFTSKDAQITLLSLALGGVTVICIKKRKDIKAAIKLLCSTKKSNSNRTRNAQPPATTQPNTGKPAAPPDAIVPAEEYEKLVAATNNRSVITLQPQYETRYRTLGPWILDYFPQYRNKPVIFVYWEQEREQKRLFENGSISVIIDIREGRGAEVFDLRDYRNITIAELQRRLEEIASNY